MAKRVILAVAGAGKTYHICNQLDKERRNLVLAYTNENVDNIRRELVKLYKDIPKNTVVMTFHAFLFRNAILPYETTIASFFSCSNFISTGISMSDPPPKGSFRNGRWMSNKYYVPKDKLGHYVNNSRQYFCKKLSELVLYVKSETKDLLTLVIGRVNKFYDCVMIDEFQDFREYDYDFLMAFAGAVDNILLVGDFYQHSVSAINNSGKPFKLRKGEELLYEEFVSQLEDMDFEVDDVSLLKSRRCSVNICDFVSKKLNISIESQGLNVGDVIWVGNLSEAEAVLRNSEIVKLVYQDASVYRFKAMNWSYSKGSTFKSVCVILTDKLEQLEDDGFKLSDQSKQTINKLYVALTRSSGNLYLMKSSLFKKLKPRYLS